MVIIAYNNQLKAKKLYILDCRSSFIYNAEKQFLKDVIKSQNNNTQSTGVKTGDFRFAFIENKY